jgi:phage terminase small subunit
VKLTVKQDEFARAYVETSCASTAYRRAYDAEGMKDNSIHVSACNVLKNPKVALRVQQLMERIQKRHDVTLDSLTKELDEDREGAREAGQYSAAISAVLGKAKLHGLIVDKSKTDIMSDGKPIAPILNVTVGRAKS